MGNLTCTASDSVANFYTPYAVPIRSFKVYFSPKQSGEGDPSPENVRPIEGWTGVTGYRCGKNLFDESNVTFGLWTSDNGTVYNNARYGCITDKIPVNNDSKFAIYRFGVNPYSYSLIEYDSQGNFIARNHSGVVTKTFVVSTLNANTKYIALQVESASTTSVTLTQEMLSSYKMMLVFGTEMPSVYEPYYGDEFPVTFPAVGKNIGNWLAPDGLHPASNYNGFNNYSGKVNARQNTVYTYSAYIDNTNGTKDSLLCVWTKQADDTTWVRTSSINSDIVLIGEAKRVSVTFTTRSTEYFIYCGLNTNVGAIISEPMLEFGSTATDYEPYKGNTYYGGYVDLISGELVQEYAIIDLSTITWDPYSTNYYAYSAFFGRNVGADVSAPIFCDKLKSLPTQSNFSSDNMTIYTRAATGDGLFVTYKTTGLSETEYRDAVRNFMNTEKPILAYKLATPITYTISPQTLSTLVHSNRFWSDADSVEIVYDLTECGDIKEERRQILLNTPHLETATGSVAKFSTDMAAKLKECKISFLPIQEGEGDPSPENVRPINGRNGLTLYQYKTDYPIEPYDIGSSSKYGMTWTVDEDGKIMVSGVPTDSSSRRIGYVYVNGDETLYASIHGDYTNVTHNKLRPENANGKLITSTFTDNTLRMGADLSLVPGVNRVGISFKRQSNGVKASGSFYVAVSAGSPPEVNEYSVTFPAVGKNLFNINHFSEKTGVTILENTITATASTLANVCGRSNGTYMPLSIASGNTITISFNSYTDANVGTNSDGLAIVLIYSDDTYARIAYTSNSETTSTSHTATYTLNKNVIGLAFGYYENTGNIWYLSNIQLEIGSTATSFEPYINTIYGGYVDLINGELVKTHEVFVLDGVNRYVYNGPNVNEHGMAYAYVMPGETYGSADLPLGKMHSYLYAVDSMPLYTTSSGITASVEGVYCSSGRPYARLVLESSKIPDTSTPEKIREGLNAWLVDHPIQICYELETPITYSLTPEIIRSLKGINNMWSDTNTDITVEFWKHGNDEVKRLAGIAYSTSDNVYLLTDDGYIIGEEEDYVIY